MGGTRKGVGTYLSLSLREREVGWWWALIKFFCLQDGRLFEVGANSRLGVYPNKYGRYIFNSSPWIKLNYTLNQLTNSPVYLVQLRAGLKSKTFITYSTEDNKGSWLVKVLVQSFCGI